MVKESEAFDKFIRGKQMIWFLIIMAIISVLFHPILSLKQRRALELQESIKASNRNRLKSFGGTSLERMN
jgi:hypothetical protein